MLSRQAAIARELCKALDCDASDSLDDIAKRANDMEKALLGAREAAGDTTDSLEEMNKEAKKGSSIFGGMWGALKKVGGYLGKGFTMAISAASAAYTFFIKQSGKVYDEMVEVRRSAEELRDTFGSLERGPGKRVLSQSRAMGKTFRKLGIGMKFGYAAGSQMNQMLGKMMGEMDPAHLGAFHQMTDDAANEMLLFGKAIGFTAKDTGLLNQRMRALGKDGPSEIKKIADISFRVQNVTGMTAIAVGKSFAAMTENVKIFGDMNSEQMGQAIAKASQLGVGVKELAAVGEAFFSFDKAAENVSRLSQAFGTNIDTMKMLNAASPADQIDEIRNSLFAAGKSAESMSRHEKALLADTLNLSAGQAELMFSQEAQYMSQEELDKAMADKDPQKQMVKGLQDVADQIKKVINSLSDMGLQGKGFFGAFTTGLTDGLFRFGRFGKTAGKTGDSLITLRQRGEDFAKNLTKEGAPLAGIFDKLDAAVAKVEPTVTKLMGPVADLIGAMAEGDMDKAKDAFASLGDIIKDAFRAIFVDSGMVQTIKDALMTLWHTASDYFIDEVVPYLQDTVVPLMSGLLEKLKDWALNNKKLVIAAFLVLFGPAVISGIISGAAGLLGGLASGLGKIFAASVPNPPPLPAPGESKGFFGAMKGLVKGLADIVTLGIPTILKAAAGAAVLGTLVAIGITPLALAMIGLAKLAGANIGGVAMLAASLGVVMLAMTPMIAIGAVLGAMMMAVPWGTAGVALIAAGFGVLSTLMGTFTASLIPVINSLADAASTIPSPRAVEAVANALAKVVGAATDLMKNLGPIIKTLKPNIFSKGQNESFASNMKLFTDLIDKIMVSVIAIVEKLADAAMKLGTPSSIQGAAALGDIIGAISNLIDVISPNLDALKTSHESYGHGYSERSTGINIAALEGLKVFYESMGPSIEILVESVVESMLKMVGGKEQQIKDAGEAAIPLFEAIRNLMGAVSALTARGTDWKDADVRDDIKLGITRGLEFLSEVVNPQKEMGGALLGFVALIPVFSTVTQAITGGQGLKGFIDTIKDVIYGVVQMNAESNKLKAVNVASAGDIRLIIRNLFNLGVTIREELFPNEYIHTRAGRDPKQVSGPLGFGSITEWIGLGANIILASAGMAYFHIAIKMFGNTVKGISPDLLKLSRSGTSLESAIVGRGTTLGFDVNEWRGASADIWDLADIFENLEYPMDRLSQAFDSFQSHASGLHDTVFASGYTNLGFGDASKWTRFAQEMKKISKVFNNSLNASTDSLAASVADFAIAIPKITRDIEKLDVVKIQAVMAQKGAAASVLEADDVSVETNEGAPAVNFHINITMDADKVARACINTSLIPGTG